jgi:hypothetical protein
VPRVKSVKATGHGLPFRSFSIANFPAAAPPAGVWPLRSKYQDSAGEPRMHVLVLARSKDLFILTVLSRDAGRNQLTPQVRARKNL